MRAGDTIKHKPSGQNYVIGWIEGFELGTLSAPQQVLAIADCELLHACDDATHAQVIAGHRREWL